MIPWFKKHRGYLHSESIALNRDSNYREITQERQSLFVSHGNVIVRGNEIYRYPFLIIYNDATPFALPSLFPLTRELSKEEVEVISKLDFGSACEHVRKYVKFFYHLRHQNSSGALCILEWDNFEDGAKFYGITTILRRVRDWCEGLMTGIFPLDNQEVEFCAHFNNIKHGIQLLYPESFIKDTHMHGEFFAPLHSYVPSGIWYEHSNRIFIGRYIYGYTPAGLLELPPQLKFNPALADGLLTLQDIIDKPERVRSLVSEQRLIKGSWFAIEHEPTPFESLDDLITIIGNGDISSGYQRLAKIAIDDFRESEFAYIALRFPNRKGEFEFQLFVLTNAKRKQIILGAVDEQNKSTIDRFEIVQAIICEKVTPMNFHERNGARAIHEILGGKTINVIGVGAIGSEVADCFAKAGVGNLHLVDCQSMRMPNAMRHLAGTKAIGIPKTCAVAEILHDHNPFINIRISNLNILGIDINDYIRQDSISVSCIADDNPEAYFNEQAVISNKKAYYVRSMRGGKVGRIFRVIPGKDACFHCLTLYRDEHDAFLRIPEDPAYPTMRNECNNPIRPASAADLKIIAALSSRIVIDDIQNGEGEINNWIWSSEDIAELGIGAHTMTKQSFKPHPKCLYCSHENRLAIELSKNALDFMQKLIAEAGGNEVGGVLAGRVEDSKIVVTDVSGPGPQAICTRTKFLKDATYCQEFLDDKYRDSNGAIVYIGEWHSHPNEDNRPSNTDIKSLTDISFQPQYLTDKPAMIIFTISGKPSATIHPASKTYYHAEINVLD